MGGNAAVALNYTAGAVAGCSGAAILIGGTLFMAGVGMAAIKVASYYTADRIDDGVIDVLILSNELQNPG